MELTADCQASHNPGYFFVHSQKEHDVMILNNTNHRL